MSVSTPRRRGDEPRPATARVARNSAGVTSRISGPALDILRNNDLEYFGSLARRLEHFSPADADHLRDISARAAATLAAPRWIVGPCDVCGSQAPLDMDALREGVVICCRCSTRRMQ